MGDLKNKWPACDILVKFQIQIVLNNSKVNNKFSLTSHYLGY